MKKTFLITIFSLAITSSVFFVGGVSVEAQVGDPRSLPEAQTPAVVKAKADIQAQAKAYAAAAASASCYQGLLGAVGIPIPTFDCMVASLSNKLLGISSWVLWAAGLVFQFTLGYSLDMAKFIKTLDIITIGWVIFRDIANICFIFILLAIAIGTILRIESYNVKKTLATVIIAALLLNFSLFFTKVVIDASNIIALQFYSQIVVNGQALTTNPVTNGANWADGGLSSAMIKSLGIESVYSNPRRGDGTPTKATDLLKGKALTIGNIIIVGVMGSVLMLCTAFVFFAGTILFIIRTVVLIFLMIFSPLAFMCLALPSLKKNFSTWQNKLVNNALFAPGYMIMIWIVFEAIGKTHTTIDNKTMNFASFITGSGDAVGTLYTFIVLIAFMLGSLLIAQHFGAGGASFARNVAGKASFGAAGWMGRQTIGRGAKALGESGAVKSFASRSSLGRGLEKRLKRTSESSFDLRNTGAGKGAAGAVGGMGDVGGKGGIAKSLKDSQKDWEDQQKRIKSESPLEQSRKEAAEGNKKIAEADLKIAETELAASKKAIDDAGFEISKDNHQRLVDTQKRVEDATKAIKENAAHIEEVTKKTGARGDAYATPDLISKTLAKIGITTAQMAMVRSVRKQKNSSPKDKAFDVLRKELKDEIEKESKTGSGEKKV